MGRLRIDAEGRPPESLLDFPAWCERVRGLPGVGFTGAVWWAEGLPASEWRRVYDAGAAWAQELAPYRSSWPPEFIPFDDYVGDVLAQLPMVVADAVAEMANPAHGWRIVAPGAGLVVHRGS